IRHSFGYLADVAAGVDATVDQDVLSPAIDRKAKQEAIAKADAVHPDTDLTGQWRGCNRHWPRRCWLCFGRRRCRLPAPGHSSDPGMDCGEIELGRLIRMIARKGRGFAETIQNRPLGRLPLRIVDPLLDHVFDMPEMVEDDRRTAAKLETRTVWKLRID